jgi:hypothetical protein
MFFIISIVYAANYEHLVKWNVTPWIFGREARIVKDKIISFILTAIVIGGIIFLIYWRYAK